MTDLEIASYLKFILQTFEDKRFMVPLKSIKYKTFHKKYEKYFKKLSEIFAKYNLDTKKYLDCWVFHMGFREVNIKDNLISNKSIVKYIDYLKEENFRRKIYKYFMKSVRNIAEESVQLGFGSAKDFLKYIITEKKLSSYYLSGKISKYYLTSMPNFKKIIEKLNGFNHDDMLDIYNKFEKYNADITSSYEDIANKKLNPLKLTDEIIFSLKNEKSKKVLHNKI